MNKTTLNALSKLENLDHSGKNVSKSYEAGYAETLGIACRDLESFTAAAKSFLRTHAGYSETTLEKRLNYEELYAEVTMMYGAAPDPTGLALNAAGYTREAYNLSTLIPVIRGWLESEINPFDDSELLAIIASKHKI